MVVGWAASIIFQSKNMSEIKEYKLFINGKWQDSLSGELDTVFNPTTEEVVGKVQNGNEQDAELALQAAEVAQKSWRNTPPRKRAELLFNLAQEIKKIANI